MVKTFTVNGLANEVEEIDSDVPDTPEDDRGPEYADINDWKEEVYSAESPPEP